MPGRPPCIQRRRDYGDRLENRENGIEKRVKERDPSSIFVLGLIVNYTRELLKQCKLKDLAICLEHPVVVSCSNFNSLFLMQFVSRDIRGLILRHPVV